MIGKKRKKENPAVPSPPWGPSRLTFDVSHAVIGRTFRRYWAVSRYPNVTRDMALLSDLSEKEGVSLRLYLRPVRGLEEHRILQAARAGSDYRSTSADWKTSREGASEKKDTEKLLETMHQSRETLGALSVFLELRADSESRLEALSDEIRSELERREIGIDPLYLRQREGFLSVMPLGSNRFGREFERIVPLSSAANLYPLQYSGKNDTHGLPIGTDIYGSPIRLDPDERSGQVTNGNVLILGNSGEGKSYLASILAINLRETGHRLLILDAEGEYARLTAELGGSVVHLGDGMSVLNPMEVFAPEDADGSPLSAQLAYLRDFLRLFHDYSDTDMDYAEGLLREVYASHGMTERTDFRRCPHDSYPTLTEAAAMALRNVRTYRPGGLYEEETVRRVAAALSSLAGGSFGRYFSHVTRMEAEGTVCFDVSGLERSGATLRDAVLLNLLRYMTFCLIEEGHTVALIDELYLFLRHPEAITTLRDAMKRVRKRGSSLILSSQNPEDFLLPEIREKTKPLFAIPSHKFLFYPGTVEEASYCEVLGLSREEFRLIASPGRGRCLYCAGGERFHLKVGVGGLKKQIVEGKSYANDEKEPLYDILR